MVRKMMMLLALLALAGCSSEVDETFEGTLESGDEVMDDNSYVDKFTFDTKAGYRVEIDMTSTDFDTFLLLQGPNGEDLGHHDDIEPGNTNSKMVLESAPLDGTYTVYANSKTSGMTGAYQVHVRATEGGGGGE